MKILHTSDWHLGQKFLYNDREEEHRRVLQWLSDLVHSEQIDMLLLAGDIFDIGSPPNYAQRLYYDFLTGLRGSSCRHIVITGGNHDSPAMLNAPSALLAALDIHVVGAATEDLADELIVLNDPASGQPEAVIAAVPFLRERDLRHSVAGELASTRSERLRDSIAAHYQGLAHLAQPWQEANIPLIAMGHLYATGAQASERQDNIYVGNIENIDAAQFPALFHYVALGHIHRAQALGGYAHVRYCGSLIPLSFSETKDDKSVYVLHFDGAKLEQVQTVPVPLYRRLKTIQGALDTVKTALRDFSARYPDGLPSWVEVMVHTDDIAPQLDKELRDFAKDMPLEILKVRLVRTDGRHNGHLDHEVQPDLGEMDVLEVFRQKFDSYGSPPEQWPQLEATFRELLEGLDEE